MDEDIQMIDFYKEEFNIPSPPFLKYKKKLEMKEKGTLFCFEGLVPMAHEMIKWNNIQLYLLNDASENDDQ
uniref:Uncharacterized protein n=1 Tax=Meloidogyne hapla TaxID=6305 RepID=A0A1I8B9B2_MELHA